MPIKNDDSDEVETFRLRLSKSDVRELRKMSLVESLKRGTRLDWGCLVRDAIKAMIRRQKPIR